MNNTEQTRLQKLAVQDFRCPGTETQHMETSRIEEVVWSDYCTLQKKVQSFAPSGRAVFLCTVLPYICSRILLYNSGPLFMTI
ncbi:hypothetical protein LIER_07338 [Lithospermum erythrorhizon]|uniref:Uncharacterized protein n=1 Tax=Lithospermum erythrorhizon TaxID=34254 RepID=A0AAV3PCG0_LITER